MQQRRPTAICGPRAAIGLGTLLCATACQFIPVEAPPDPWAPGTTYATDPTVRRGLIDVRGLIHAHSVYSHDACDYQPEVDGVRNQQCFEDFRAGLCTSKHDFVMLTDHRDAFSATEYPEILLYRAERGDQLVERNGGPVANWLACPGQEPALIMAGTEAETMPVGLERHVAERDERSDIYGDRSPESLAALREAGAVLLVQHTEDWDVHYLTTLGIDGFEMFNLHATMMLNLIDVITIYVQILEGDTEALPHPDLIGLPFLREDPRYLERWGGTLAAGVKRVTTMGTDCHRNSFETELPDGERGDSYRRMMQWFSNHVLVRPRADGSWKDSDLKTALRAGRLYGAYEIYGYPIGFDYYAETTAGLAEMGTELTLADAPTFIVKRPTLQNLDARAQAPVTTQRILRALPNGWELMAQSETDLRWSPTEVGAYRAEVRIVPHHIRADLGQFRERVLGEGRIWIYSNAIYVR